MKKIIITSIVVALVLIIGITTLTLALIPVGINNNIERPNEIYICSTDTKAFPYSTLAYLDIDDEEKDEITNIYSKFSHAFEQNLLSAIFKGETKDEMTTNYHKISNSISKNTSKEDVITIIFKYNEKQTIKVEGREPATYDSILFEITPNDERVNVEIGARTDTNIENSTFYYNYSYNAKANFCDLYEYVKYLINN